MIPIAVCALLASSAIAPSESSLFRVAQLRYDGGQWNPRPHALRRLSFELERRTSIVARHEPLAVHATDTALEVMPFLYWTGEGDFAEFSEAASSALRRYVKAGGLIFVDAVDEGFWRGAKRELARILPDAPIVRVAEQHVLYKTFYLVTSEAGRVARTPYVEGQFQEERLAVIISGNDHGGAWSRDDFGRSDFVVEPGGEAQREMAIRFGVNVAMYALCLEYKDDQVHIPFIMRRRK